MARVNGSTLVGRALKNEGVRAVFTLCGGLLCAIYDTCVDEGIELVSLGLYQRLPPFTKSANVAIPGLC